MLQALLIAMAGCAFSDSGRLHRDDGTTPHRETARADRVLRWNGPISGGWTTEEVLSGYPPLLTTSCSIVVINPIEELPSMSWSTSGQDRGIEPPSVGFHLDPRDPPEVPVGWWTLQAPRSPSRGSSWGRIRGPGGDFTSSRVLTFHLAADIPARSSDLRQRIFRTGPPRGFNLGIVEIDSADWLITVHQDRAAVIADGMARLQRQGARRVLVYERQLRAAGRPFDLSLGPAPTAHRAASADPDDGLLWQINLVTVEEWMDPYPLAFDPEDDPIDLDPRLDLDCRPAER